jgi:hypothetical protein
MCKISSGKQFIVILLCGTGGVPSMRALIASFVICRQGGQELSVSESHSLFITREAPVIQGHLIHEDSRSHTMTHHSR